MKYKDKDKSVTIDPNNKESIRTLTINAGHILKIRDMTKEINEDVRLRLDVTNKPLRKKNSRTPILSSDVLEYATYFVY